MHRKHLGFVIALTVLVGSLVPACRDSNEAEQVGYEEISEKETTQAMQKAFVNSKGELAADRIPPGINRFFSMLGVTESCGQAAFCCQSSSHRLLARRARSWAISSALSSRHHAPGILSRFCKICRWALSTSPDPIGRFPSIAAA